MMIKRENITRPEIKNKKLNSCKRNKATAETPTITDNFIQAHSRPPHLDQNLSFIFLSMSIIITRNIINALMGDVNENSKSYKQVLITIKKSDKMNYNDDIAYEIDGYSYYGLTTEEGLEIPEDTYSKIVKIEDSRVKTLNPEKVNVGNLILLSHLGEVSLNDIHRVYDIMEYRYGNEKRTTVITENVTSPEGKNARLTYNLNGWNVFFSDLDVEDHKKKVSKFKEARDLSIPEESEGHGNVAILMVFCDESMCKIFDIGEEIVHRTI